MFKEPLNIEEKMIARTISAFVIGIIGFSCLGTGIVKQLNNQKSQINRSLAETTAQISSMETDISQIESHTKAYSALINSVDSLNEATLISQNSRVISKEAIPNLLTKIMFIIPQKVQITSIENTSNKHIVIEAVSEKYEQLGYFVAAIKEDGMLQNIQTTSGTKNDSLVQITIEGDLP
jgi:Tfp pilus assembly protein PilN